MTRVQELFDTSNIHFEVLHMMINQGNSIFELTRNILHFMFRVRPGIEGTGKLCHHFDVVLPGSAAAFKWRGPSSGTRQPLKWRQVGFDFEWLVKVVLRSCRVGGQSDSMKRPITGFHGGQVETLFTRQDELWDHSTLKGLIKELEDLKIDEHKKYWTALMGLWRAVGGCHQQLNHPRDRVDIDVLKSHVAEFEKHLKVFVHTETNPVPEAFRYSVKSYDHALMHHMVSDTEKLLQNGFAPCMMSSRFLEHANKYIKQLSKRLPGGGQIRADCGHLPIVQLFRKLLAKNRFDRIYWYVKVERGLRQMSANT